MGKRKIWFKTSEKLALLRIMIDIYNYYPRRFDDKAINVIIKTAKKTFNLPNGYKEASTMPISEAKSKIKYYSHDYWKQKFLGDFLSILLCASNTKDASKLKWDYISDLSRELRFTISPHFGAWGLSDWIIVDTHDEMMTNKRRIGLETNLISCPKTNKVVKQSLSEFEFEDSTLLQPDVFSLGQGCVKDYNQAIEWWEKAANLGDANAMYNLGVAYAEGEIVKRNLSKATELFLQAEELGCERASSALANMDDDDYDDEEEDDDYYGDYDEDCDDEFDANEFTYSFTINSRPSLHGTVRLPMTNNMVHFGQFRPDAILNKNFQHTAIVGVNHYETAAEFRNDCEAIVNLVNATISNSNIQGSFQEALICVVENHIRRCNRIFINDLMAYMDTFCELLIAIGWSKETARKEYPALLLALAKKYNNYVLEAFNDFSGNHIPFKNSVRYENLLNHVAKEFPQLVR